MTFGLIVGNRGFFPDHLAKTGREQMIAAIERAGHKAVCLTPEQSKHGAVETRAEARQCADLFRANRDQIDGIIVTLPNFGEERGIAEALRMADLRVPILIQATPDTPGRMTIADRRDSFCGKMSICNNLQQYRIPYSLTKLHTEAPDSAEFARISPGSPPSAASAMACASCASAPSARGPAAFNTVRYSEKLLEASGITVEPLDLSEVFGRIGRLKCEEPDVQAKARSIRAVCLDATESPTTRS